MWITSLCILFCIKPVTVKVIYFSTYTNRNFLSKYKVVCILSRFFICIKSHITSYGFNRNTNNLINIINCFFLLVLFLFYHKTYIKYDIKYSFTNSKRFTVSIYNISPVRTYYFILYSIYLIVNSRLFVILSVSLNSKNSIKTYI